MIKRITAILMAAVLAFSLCACGEQTPQTSPQTDPATAADTKSPETDAPAQAPTEAPTQAPTEGPTEAPTEPPTEPGPTEPEEEPGQVAYGYNGMVAAADPTAAQVGVDILKAGGNAMDAAIATAFALSLTENAASGIGGSGVLLYYDASTGKTTAIDYYFQCPAAMVLSDFVDSSVTRNRGMGGLRAVVPGFVAGMETACDMFATMSLADLIAPTIKLAEEGVAVTPFMAENYRDYYARMQRYPETLRVFSNDGFPFGEGDVFKNPDFAKTLRIIAEKGSAGFYEGEIAEAIVSSVRATGSKMTLQDLADYHVVVSEPLTTTYRGYQIVTAPPVSDGGIVLEALNIAEHFDIGSLEFGSVEYLHLWGEIFHVAMADLTSSFEDPAFYDLSRVRGLVTKEYAVERAKQVHLDSTWTLGPIGDAAAYDPDSHTTHLSVIDKDGNMVTMTNTHGDYFGTLTTVTDYGFLIENTSAFDPSNATYYPEPGKRGRTPMCPTLIFTGDGKPFAAVGTPGSSRILTTVTLIISNLIDYKLDLKTALDRPRLFQARNGNLYLEGGFSKDVTEPLEALGHTLTWRVNDDSYFGGAHCVSIDPETGQMTGAADIRRSGVAIGY